jgi:hypothetical protein
LGDKPESAPSLAHIEVCPNCGELVPAEKFNHDVGWCNVCAPPEVVKTTEQAVQTHSYLLTHADEIEHYLLQGKSLNQAIDLLYSANGRPKCIVCGSTMSRAPKRAVICRKTGECRRVSRRYIYLYRERGLSKAQALAEIFKSLDSM